uniref:Family with sequence similarity 107 member B n=2 Tax=Xenopus tropicalis TaxID=8364 RepID=A0A803J894_XENTR
MTKGCLFLWKQKRKCRGRAAVLPALTCIYIYVYEHILLISLITNLNHLHCRSTGQKKKLTPRWLLEHTELEADTRVKGLGRKLPQMNTNQRDTSVFNSDFGDPYLVVKNIMAEPDYIDGDNPELIRPQKLVNPVKTSRNHQDLHRELLLNQKRGLSPQNKPELQKVMEKRKRDQIFKQQQVEAEQKKTEFEKELQKRHQMLEEMEMENQKITEEQENKPEFLKVKGNLRKMNQEISEANNS